MITRFTPLVPLLFALLAPASPLAAEETRVFKTVQGAEVEAEIMGVQMDIVQLKTASKVIRLKIGVLTEEDQAYIRKHWGIRAFRIRADLKTVGREVGTGTASEGDGSRRTRTITTLTAFGITAESGPVPLEGLTFKHIIYFSDGSTEFEEKTVPAIGEATTEKWETTTQGKSTVILDGARDIPAKGSRTLRGIWVKAFQGETEIAELKQDVPAGARWQDAKTTQE